MTLKFFVYLNLCHVNNRSIDWKTEVYKKHQVLSVLLGASCFICTGHLLGLI